jgi:tetratricopeptide (TPR) repeat protein
MKTAIIGLGGVGKTQVALELAYRTREKYRNCSVFWIPVTDMDNLHQAYRDVAQQLRIPGCDEDKADVKKLVQEHLSQENSRPWLLIFDNADDVDMWIGSPGSAPGSAPGTKLVPSSLKEFLPRSKQGCIVFTTRDKKTAVKLVGQNFVEVPEMNEDGAIQLLQRSLPDIEAPVDEQDAKALLAELTYLPLAIVQAAAYMNANSISPANYLSLCKEQEEDVIELLSEEFEDEWRYKSVKNPVATTWLISFEQIRMRDSLATEYLSFMACINRKDIPQSLLPSGRSRKLEIEAMGTLRAYSFIITRGQAAVFDLHRLVHLATRIWLRKQGTLCRWSQAAIERLDELFPDESYWNRAQWRVFLPHAAYALQGAHIAQDNDRSLSLTEKYARSLYHDGRYNEAEKPHQELFEARLRVLGEEHPSTLTSMANLASTYWNQGRWKEAEELEVRVVEMSSRVLGEEHPSTLTSIANLASTYWNQGRWKEAEELFVRVVEISSRVLGEEHPDILTSMANLASTYWNQGRWKEAEELELRVVEMSSRVLGEEHPDTLTSMANLASTYRNQGRWKEAEELFVRVVEISSRVLGEEHPSTLTSIANLASTYRNQGRWKEAEELFVREVEMSSRVLGEEHPDTLTSMANLASSYWNQGRWKEAEELEVRVVEMSSRVLGKEHPSTLTSMANLAFTWKGQGRNKEAVRLMEECVSSHTHVLGVRHHLTVSSAKVLAGWRIEQLHIDKGVV